MRYFVVPMRYSNVLFDLIKLIIILKLITEQRTMDCHGNVLISSLFALFQ